MTQRNPQTTAQAVEDGFTAGAGAQAPASSESEQMAEFSITRDGPRYRYNGYRYDRLADAVAYARLMRARPAHSDVGGPFTQGSATWAPPTDGEREAMASLDIRFVDGTYRFADFRYDRLADAVNYATLSLRRQRGVPE